MAKFAARFRTKGAVMKKVTYLTIAVVTLLIGHSTFYSNHPHHNQAVLGYSTDMSVGELIAYLNNDRSSAGVGAISLNSQLNQAAQAKANDMVAENYWSHYSPSGAAPWNFILNSGYNYHSAAENLAYGYDTAAQLMDGWMGSSEHRANMLSGSYADVGFGIANSTDFMGSGTQTVVVAEFASPAVAATPAPTYHAPAPPVSTPAATEATPSPAVTTAPPVVTQPAPAAVQPTPNPVTPPSPPVTAPLKSKPPITKITTSTKKDKRPLSTAKLDASHLRNLQKFDTPYLRKVPTNPFIFSIGLVILVGFLILRLIEPKLDTHFNKKILT